MKAMLNWGLKGRRENEDSTGEQRNGVTITMKGGIKSSVLFLRCEK